MQVKNIQWLLFHVHTGKKKDWQPVPDSRVHGANMGPHVGPMNFAIWVEWVSLKFSNLSIMHTSI